MVGICWEMFFALAGGSQCAASSKLYTVLVPLAWFVSENIVAFGRQYSNI